MSRINQIVEKAEREGLLTWTRPADGTDHSAAAVQEAPLPAAAPPATAAPDTWDTSETAVPQTSGIHPLFVAATEPGSTAAEQYRLLRTRLEAPENGRRAQVLLVTSPQMGDGKTTTSANLALTMSQEFQQKVVLVEADLRRPTLASLFGLPEGPGLVDILVGGATLEAALTPVPGQRLVVLPAGMPAVRSTELLASAAMQRVIEGLRARFDRVVIDSAPVGVADTHVLSRVTDGVLLVVRAGVTTRPAIERALDGMDRDKVLGMVLNEVDDASGTYDYRYGRYGYGYGYEYGSTGLQEQADGK
jgi:capsular exopolysaccharide synthesis family protein